MEPFNISLPPGTEVYGEPFASRLSLEDASMVPGTQFGLDYRHKVKIEALIDLGCVINSVNSMTRSANALLLNLVVPEFPSTKKFMPRLSELGTEVDDLYLDMPKLSDLPDFLAAEYDDVVRQHAICQPVSQNDLTKVIGTAYYNWLRGDATILVLRKRGSITPLAKLALRRLVPPGVLDVGYVTMPGCRGRNYSGIALRAFTQWVFENAGISRIELGIKPMNIASIRVAKFAGYSFESVRSARLSNCDGTFEDEHSYVSLIALMEEARV